MLFKWDWYQATLMPDVSLLEFRQDISLLFGEPQIYKGHRGYDFCEDWKYVKIQTGGPSGIWGPHVIIYGGDFTERIVWHLRHFFPDHRVTRFDVCVDYCFKGAWDWALTRAYDILNVYGLKPNYQGDWYTSEFGKTLYLGSRTSTHFCRLYEKGKQLRESGLNPDADPNWIRVEFEVKPSKTKKFLSSKLDPDDVAFSSEWTCEFANILSCSGFQSVSLSTARTRNKTMKSLCHMFHQYSSVLKKAVVDGDLTADDLHDALQTCIDTGNFVDFKSILESDNYFDPHSSIWLPASSIQSAARNSWINDSKPSRAPDLPSRVSPKFGF